MCAQFLQNRNDNKTPSKPPCLLCVGFNSKTPPALGLLVCTIFPVPLLMALLSMQKESLNEPKQKTCHECCCQCANLVP